ncbi:hypothetical protein JTB14_033072 [Gonioctena quinquepunctata]|nr:hypothetical protein JTB14_033072 [Gonioctena quinquepunctata]
MQVLTIILVAIFICEKTETTIIQSCDSLIYCQGELLEVVQKARIFNDSKTFVDLSQKNDANETLERFNSFMESYNNSPTREEVGDFVKENFGSIVELEKWTPSDYITNPKFLKKIEDITVRDFARNLIRIWPNLARKVKSGRFTEIYYWDSYWIVEGLIISEMTETVRGILENFLSLVERYGFVPNGSRVYYLNRSQPPLLSSMVRLYIDATNDLDWLRKHINTLEKELKWWCDNRTIKIKKNGKYHQLARYASESGTPRPESYFEDLITCSTYSGADKVRFSLPRDENH